MARIRKDFLKFYLFDLIGVILRKSAANAPPKFLLTG